MALPGSGAISLGNIQTEFGGANPISLSEYYKNGGGGYVTSTDTVPNVPVSGAISLDNFHGAAKVTTIIVSVDTNFVSGSKNIPPNGNATTDPVTASPLTGTAPYTYLWEYVSGGTFTVSASTSATTTFIHFVNSDVPYTGVYRCRVTDNNGAVGYSVDVTAEVVGIPI